MATTAAFTQTLCNPKTSQKAKASTEAPKPKPTTQCTSSTPITRGNSSCPSTLMPPPSEFTQTASHSHSAFSSNVRPEPLGEN
ncbi:hypothetical protein BDQ12DRAFT_729965 [Crucibulum laeve]|uniref:Uncharacterized protein n=1 Tax=Crucibulum laeve TaxID=68775 RepID=A0A5C3LD82_9AGAR|nr:hypothetical protein BDQ12DRAFT_729965 [Crucibulum laeve]